MHFIFDGLGRKSLAMFLKDRRLETSFISAFKGLTISIILIVNTWLEIDIYYYLKNIDTASEDLYH